jgi:S-adenosylmethionine decarboxylase
MRRLGRHAVIDVSRVAKPLDEAQAASLLADMAQVCGATVLRIESHHFGPGHGLTAVALLAESHISLHEWPEYGFIAFDIFVCGAAEPEPAIELLRARFPEAHVVAQIIDRESLS